MPAFVHIDVSARDDHSISPQVSAAAVSAGAPLLQQAVAAVGK
jgi:hypothetical protein